MLYAAVTTVLFLVGLELLAWAWEWTHLPPEQAMPAPAPGNHGAYRDWLREHGVEVERRLYLDRDTAGDWRLPADQQGEGVMGMVRTNSLGLRGPEVGTREPGEQRILTVGDSTTFGFGVKESRIYSEVAADELEEAWSVPVRVVHGAIPGYDSAQAVRILRRVGPRVAPDWVVVACLWSDLYAVGGVYRAQEAYDEVARGVLHRTATWRVLVRWLTPWLRSRRVRWITSRAEVGGLPDGPPARVDLEQFSSNLATLAYEARELGARPAFVVLAAPMDFDEAPVPEPVALYREAIRQVAGRFDAPVVDAPPLFRAACSLDCFLDHVHPDPKGHALLGEALAGAILEVAPQPVGAE